MNNPFFSIIIPTRNRAHLLKFALQGVVNQTFDDYEVIVSNNNSEDNTEEIVRSFNSPKIRYFETGTDLDAIESWNFAFSHARGEYLISLIADDDCITPDSLTIYHDQIVSNGFPDLLLLPNCWYVHPFYESETKTSNTLRLPFDLKFEQLPRQKVIDAFLNFQLMGYSPTYMIFNHKIKREEKLFLPPFPDYAAFFRLLLRSTKPVYKSDYPGIIHGYSAESLGEHAFGKRKRIEWQEVPKDLFVHVPLQGYFFVNGWAESILRVLDEEKMGEYAPNWKEYFKIYYTQLMMDAEWRNIEGERANYFETLIKFPGGIYDEIALDIEQYLKPPQHFQGRDPWIHCGRYGIGNIYECACQLDAFLYQALFFKELFYEKDYRTILAYNKKIIAEKAYYFYLGRVQFIEQKFDEAIKYLMLFIEIGDNDSFKTFIDDEDYLISAKFYLGLSYYEQKNYNQALCYFRECNQLSAGNHIKAQEYMKLIEGKQY